MLSVTFFLSSHSAFTLIASHDKKNFLIPLFRHPLLFLLLSYFLCFTTYVLPPRLPHTTSLPPANRHHNPEKNHSSPLRPSLFILYHGPTGA
ncbi:hypothetical protein TRV_03686 [Trichophyton verrucosum HKI 0517]|uniref:Uncharacterized protein n=1 Tax=Trichophyton verrucosum (strain HKI 0517) TaxID=663202 RepID=D4D995_TRIVH|nr:uncharacterized protein TRV_03686 [Trichophyton verrucosum HKI 0517]EFE41587.1 hypothetical protein TRV_03686 [Trichophyton verrucosum HKI 0517]